MAVAKKKKRFRDIEIPLIRKTTQAYSFTLEELNGKYLNYDLSRILKGKSRMLQGQIVVQNDEATAVPRKLVLMSYFLKRMVRKGTNQVEDSFVAECKDSFVRLKPFLITRRKVSRAVRKALREKSREELIKYAKTKNSYEIFEEILSNSLPKDLSIKLKKVYPLSLCELRVIRVESFKEGYPNIQEYKKEKEDKKVQKVDKNFEKDMKTKSAPKKEIESEEKEKDLNESEEKSKPESKESKKAEETKTTKKKSSKKDTQENSKE